jgi:hypothetical protein
VQSLPSCSRWSGGRGKYMSCYSFVNIRRHTCATKASRANSTCELNSRPRRRTAQRSQQSRPRQSGMHFGTLIDTELEPTDQSNRVELRAHSHALAGKNGDLTAARSTQHARHRSPLLRIISAYVCERPLCSLLPKQVKTTVLVCGFGRRWQ